MQGQDPFDGQELAIGQNLGAVGLAGFELDEIHDFAKGALAVD